MIPTVMVPVTTPFVRYQGRVWRNEGLPLDVEGRMSLVSLRDSSRGMRAELINVHPCSPEEIEACLWWADRKAKREFPFNQT